MIKRKKKSLSYIAYYNIDETTVDSCILNTNAEFKLQFFSGKELTFRDNGLTGDQWVNGIKSAIFDIDVRNTGPNTERKLSKRLKTKKKI